MYRRLFLYVFKPENILNARSKDLTTSEVGSTYTSTNIFIKDYKDNFFLYKISRNRLYFFYLLPLFCQIFK